MWTDGACRGNPGPGGWAAIVVPAGGDAPVELSGGERHTTNNRMAIRSALIPLAALKGRSRVTERDALCDPTGLGAFRVIEWRME